MRWTISARAIRRSSYLRAFPFDKIKIDQRFVRDIDTSVENQAIVRAVISLARDLGMRVTAEGVENEQQATILAGLGCTEVQGFLYSRPVARLGTGEERRPGPQRRHRPHPAPQGLAYCTQSLRVEADPHLSAPEQSGPWSGHRPSMMGKLVKHGSAPFRGRTGGGLLGNHRR